MISFDVFDTLITRCTATPEGIFALMQYKLEIDSRFKEIDFYLRKNFFLLRVHAVELARESFCVRDVQELKLEQIYDCLVMEGGLSPDDKKQMMQLEYETEYECSLPLPSNISMLKRYLEAGERVVLISDMYLESSFIRKLLIKADICLKDIPLYVSVDFDRNKWSGDLYQIVQKYENVEFKHWVHYGDNKISDVISANRLGIETHEVHIEELMEHEQILFRKENYEMQLCIGAARYARSKAELKSTAYRIGSSVGGVVLYPYILWVLSESLKRGVRQLYFIARDGYILKALADIVINQHQYPIKTHYLYGSRRAWRMASLTEDVKSLDELIWWSNIYSINNLVDFAEIFQLDKEELKNFFPDTFVEGNWEMQPGIFDFCRKRVYKNRKFIHYLCKKHAHKRELTVSYLKQEIQTKENDFAFVDLGGTGFTQQCLANIMKEFYPGKIKTFFYKLDRYQTNDLCEFYNFFPSFMDSNIIIEMLARAPHGQTVGYQIAQGDKVIPVMDEEGKALNEYGYEDYVQGMIEYAYIRSRAVESIPVHEQISIQAAEKYLKYITIEPNEEIKNYIGDMPTSETGRGEVGRTFAPKLTKTQIKNIFLGRKSYEIKEKYYNGTYLNYSLMRCTKSQLKLVDEYKKNYSTEVGKEYRKILGNTEEKISGFYFPLQILKGRIALYAAGKVGRDWYKKFTALKEIKVVLWVDQNFNKYQKEGLKVENPKKLLEIVFDQLIIAVLNENQYQTILGELQALGIEERKILWFNPNIQKPYQLADRNNRMFRED